MPKEFTQEGYDKLKKELDYLKGEKTREVAQQLKHATSFGDFSENAAYDQAKENKAFLRGRILELENALKKAKIVTKNTSGKIGMGSIVEVMLNNEKEKLQLVSAEEADPFNGKISLQSPLGTALRNKQIGQTAQIQSPSGTTLTYQILNIE